MLDDNEDVKTFASAADVVKKIQDQLDAADIPVTVSSPDGTLDFKSDQYGKCIVGVSKNNVPSGYMMYDLFDRGHIQPLTPNPANSAYEPAYFKGQRVIGGTNTLIPKDCTLTYTVTFNDALPQRI